jgi:hypothetical protein
MKGVWLESISTVCAPMRFAMARSTNRNPAEDRRTMCMGDSFAARI